MRWKEHPERVNHMKHMTPSELSRRRLVGKGSTNAPDSGASEAVEVPAEEKPQEHMDSDHEDDSEKDDSNSESSSEMEDYKS